MSHASASAIIDSGKHPLHTGGGTYQKTYSEVLTKKGNSEMIFVTEYDLGLGKTHMHGYFNMPDGFKSGWGSNTHIYEASVERFEYKDGTPGNKNRALFNNEALELGLSVSDINVRDKILKDEAFKDDLGQFSDCLLYTSPSPRD